jgi:uncharacterized membrane protein YccC
MPGQPERIKVPSDVRSQYFRALQHRAGRELRALFEPGARMVDEIECVLSVLLAIVFAHAISAHNISWAAFSGFMVMRGHVAESFLRGVLRIVGTAVGAVLALIIVPVVVPMAAAALVSAVVGGVTLYKALTARRAYAWLFVGLTFELILLDTLEHPSLAVTTLVTTRLLEVVAGTTACVIVSTLSTVTARRHWPAPPVPTSTGISWHPQAVRHAAQGAVALALLPLVRFAFAVPELAQSSITIMAVMMIPVESIGTSGLAPVSRRLILRAIGCVSGGALAALFLFAAHGTPAVLVTGTCLGVILGRHIENGRTAIAYIGTQFTLATLVTLVPDSYADAQIGPALERLAGVFIGMVVLEPVLLGWHFIAPLRKERAPTVQGEAEAE